MAEKTATTIAMKQAEQKAADQKAEAEAAEKQAEVEAKKRLFKKLNRMNKKQLSKLDYQALRDS